MRTIDSIRTGASEAVSSDQLISQSLASPPTSLTSNPTKSDATLTLPAAKTKWSQQLASAFELPPPASATSDVPGYGLRVLVVDDNSIALAGTYPAPLPVSGLMSTENLTCIANLVGAVTKRLLQRKFAHLLNPKGAMYARSGSDALQRIQEDVFDLILLDMHMPGLSGPHGMDCAEIIRQGRLPGPAAQANRTSLIVAVTSDCEPWQRDQYRSAFLDGLIPKPVCQNHLRTFLEAVQRQAQLLQRPGRIPWASSGHLADLSPPLPPSALVVSPFGRAFFDGTQTHQCEPALSMGTPAGEADESPRSFASRLLDQTCKCLDSLERSYHLQRLPRLAHVRRASQTLGGENSSFSSRLTICTAYAPVTPIEDPVAPSLDHLMQAEASSPVPSLVPDQEDSDDLDFATSVGMLSPSLSCPIRMEPWGGPGASKANEHLNVTDDDGLADSDSIRSIDTATTW